MKSAGCYRNHFTWNTKRKLALIKWIMQCKNNFSKIRFIDFVCVVKMFRYIPRIRYFQEPIPLRPIGITKRARLTENQMNVQNNCRWGFTLVISNIPIASVWVNIKLFTISVIKPTKCSPQVCLHSLASLKWPHSQSQHVRYPVSRDQIWVKENRRSNILNPATPDSRECKTSIN